MKGVVAAIIGWGLLLMMAKSLVLAWVLMLMFGIVGLAQFGYNTCVVLVWLFYLGMIVFSFKFEFTTSETSAFGGTRTYKGNIG